MTRLMTRENVKLLIVAVVCLLVAWSAPAVAHGVHAAFAHNADKVDGKHAVGSNASPTQAKGKLVAHNNQGKLPAKFVAPDSTIRTTHPATGWTPNASGPTTVLRFSTETTVSGDGSMQIPLSAPQNIGGARYGLKHVEICYRAVSGGRITQLFVWGQSPSAVEALKIDNTDRTATTFTCYTVPVGRRAPYGATIWVQLSNGGSVVLHNVRAVWTLSTATVAPRVVHSASPGTGGNR